MQPRPSFQYRRTSTLPASVKSSKTRPQSLPSAPLQEASSRPSAQHLAYRPSHAEKRLSIANPPTTKKQRRKRTRDHLYRQIDGGVPEEVRLKLLVEGILKEEYEIKYADATAENREQFEEGMLYMSDYMRKFVEEMAESDEAVARKTRPNPANDELERRAAQLEQVIENYKLELENWESVQNESNQPLELPDLPEEPDADDLAGLPDADELVTSAAEAVQTYILQTDHMRSVLKGLESRNKETHSRVQALAAVLNEKVMSEFGQCADENLAPPQNMTNVKI